jgi:choloylglycine hydrolase
MRTLAVDRLLGCLEELLQLAEPVYLVPVSFGPGNAGHATVHLSLSDSSGYSAIMEYLDGKLVIHHGQCPTRLGFHNRLKF